MEISRQWQRRKPRLVDSTQQTVARAPVKESTPPKRQFTRERAIAGSLPLWAPVPPASNSVVRRER